METKDAIREMMKTRRAAVSEDDSKTVEHRIAARFSRIVKLPPRCAVALYWPINNEVGTIALAHELHKMGHLVVMPTIETPGRPLVFRRWTPLVSMIDCKHGTKAPPPDQPVLSPGLIIAPLLAFDSEGHRLGYGGGYYDRTVAALRAEGKNIGFLGLGYSFQGVPKLPAEAHDQAIDAIMSEKGVHSFKKGSV